MATITKVNGVTKLVVGNFTLSPIKEIDANEALNSLSFYSESRKLNVAFEDFEDTYGTTDAVEFADYLYENNFVNLGGGESPETLERIDDLETSSDLLSGKNVTALWYETIALDADSNGQQFAITLLQNATVKENAFANGFTALVRMLENGDITDKNVSNVSGALEFLSCSLDANGNGVISGTGNVSENPSVGILYMYSIPFEDYNKDFDLIHIVEPEESVENLRVKVKSTNPILPKAGYKKIYPLGDGVFYTIDSDGIVQKLAYASKVLDDPDLLQSTSSLPSFTTALSDSVTIDLDGTYLIEGSYGCGSDSTSRDFISKLSLNGTPLHALTYMQRQEMQDSSGDDDGLLTDQRQSFSFSYKKDLTAGVANFLLEITSNGANTIYIWDIIIKVTLIA